MVYKCNQKQFLFVKQAQKLISMLSGVSACFHVTELHKENL